MLAIAQVVKLQPASVVVCGVVESVSVTMVQHAGFVADVTPQISAQVTATRHSEIAAAVTVMRDAIAGQLPGAEVSLIVAQGEPETEIVRLASEVGADIIVMSTRGRSGVRRAVLGSVADYIVSRALGGVAVLTIHP